MEIAYRMQKNHYKIEQCNDAYVYTNTPTYSLKTLQTKTSMDLRFYQQYDRLSPSNLQKEIRHISAIFTLPSGIVSVFAASLSYSLSSTLLFFQVLLYNKLIQVHRLVGIDYSHQFCAMKFDPFFINTHSLYFYYLLSSIL
jgi:hypothetical protein